MVSYGSTVYCTILSVSYLLIIILLRKTLKQMNAFGDFNHEQKKVIKQFALFVLAFFLKLVLQLIYSIGFHNARWSVFTYDIIEVFGHILITFLPISYMIYCHHVTYKSQLAQEEADSYD